ncbi:hypothetical protein PGK76_005790 [Riemerella anatipestifer]|uniref:hypothetical protein n=1 Tax=Riemerella anatipestifer TaxID=34085 RepID=UPI001372CA25|nr:hypothetical protein [Riemerella anatipestifer]MBT0556348.1 hypothetical protein [Riemerella anatipestifer]MCO7354146.1 hypothetical protein [Riemerella anatipestifer]MCU7540182.1 hypothetical protein [Riemerella anatipestifer]MCU7570031.1 hypothetical protein [Riemerella anatipestifer]MCW0516888.1 hypothetical protein [Riemerella anatipestifer]
MNNRKFLDIFYLIISNLMLFCCVYKLCFSIKISVIFFNALLSLSCLNFAIITSPKTKLLNKESIWYIISEWILGFVIVSFFTKFFSIRSSELQLSFWFSVCGVSLLGGILTIVNHNKIFGSKIDIKKYFIWLILLTFLFPLVSYFFFKFMYHKEFYDLSFYIIIPEIIIVLIWQIFMQLSLKKY